MRFLCGVDDCLIAPVAVGFALHECGTVIGLAYCFMHQLKGRDQVSLKCHHSCQHVTIEFDFRDFVAEHPELAE